MAEEQKQTRRIRKVETVREKAEKAAITKPKRLGKTRRAAGAPFRVAGQGIGKAGRKANSIKPLRILGYIIVPPYFRNSWRELRQVTWPNMRESTRLTIAVILFAIIFGAIVTVLDIGLDKIFKEVLIK